MTGRNSPIHECFLPLSGMEVACRSRLVIGHSPRRSLAGLSGGLSTI